MLHRLKCFWVIRIRGVTNKERIRIRTIEVVPISTGTRLIILKMKGEKGEKQCGPPHLLGGASRVV